MSLELIAEKLKASIGLHTPTVGMVTVSSAIDRRMRERKITSYKEYLMCISTERDEMKQLVETVIIPETWFFREEEPYHYMLEYFKEQPATETLSVLSMPCSTGEEPYSVAMTLLDNCIHPSRFEIDAIDVAETNIEKALYGEYRKNSFRSSELGFMDRYFTRKNNNYVISDTLKGEVNFHCGNVLNNPSGSPLKQYDIIFCRNLLIYFDAETQKEVFSTISRMLKPEGILILGHAETAQCSDGEFVPAADSKSFAYVKSTNLKKAKQQKSDRHSEYSKDQRSAKRPIKAIVKPFANNRTSEPSTSANKDDHSKVNLGFAFELANEGKLDEAMSICTGYLETEHESSRAYYLLGIIHDAKGNTSKADEALKKAIYLDPDNLEALIHLSLMAEQDGQHEEAMRLRNRAQRVQERRAG